MVVTKQAQYVQHDKEWNAANCKTITVFSHANHCPLTWLITAVGLRQRAISDVSVNDADAVHPERRGKGVAKKVLADATSGAVQLLLGKGVVSCPVLGEDSLGISNHRVPQLLLWIVGQLGVGVALKELPFVANGERRKLQGWRAPHQCITRLPIDKYLGLPWQIDSRHHIHVTRKCRPPEVGVVSGQVAALDVCAHGPVVDDVLCLDTLSGHHPLSLSSLSQGLIRDTADDSTCKATT
jgi:hypothetical protein